MKTAAIIILGAFVVWLVLLCSAWSERYDELQTEYDKAFVEHGKTKRVDLIAKDEDVWVVVDLRYLYEFEGACRGNQLRTF